jgi:hypothetical protein
MQEGHRSSTQRNCSNAFGFHGAWTLVIEARGVNLKGLDFSERSEGGPQKFVSSVRKL